MKSRVSDEEYEELARTADAPKLREALAIGKRLYLEMGDKAEQLEKALGKACGRLGSEALCPRIEGFWNEQEECSECRVFDVEQLNSMRAACWKRYFLEGE